MKRALVLCVLLIGCGTPQERCIQRETRDVRILDRLIAETDGNIKRGYALEEVTVTTYKWVRCYEPSAPPAEGQPAPPRRPSLCFEPVDETVTRPKAIDLRAEADKLASMRDKRAALTRAAQPAIAQCKAVYPE